MAKRAQMSKRLLPYDAYRNDSIQENKAWRDVGDSSYSIPSDDTRNLETKRSLNKSSRVTTQDQIARRRLVPSDTSGDDSVQEYKKTEKWWELMDDGSDSGSRNSDVKGSARESKSFTSQRTSGSGFSCSDFSMECNEVSRVMPLKKPKKVLVSPRQYNLAISNETTMTFERTLHKSADANISSFKVDSSVEDVTRSEQVENINPLFNRRPIRKFEHGGNFSRVLSDMTHLVSHSSVTDSVYDQFERSKCDVISEVASDIYQSEEYEGPATATYCKQTVERNGATTTYVTISEVKERIQIQNRSCRVPNKKYNSPFDLTGAVTDLTVNSDCIFVQHIDSSSRQSSRFIPGGSEKNERKFHDKNNLDILIETQKSSESSSDAEVEDVSDLLNRSGPIEKKKYKCGGGSGENKHLLAIYPTAFEEVLGDHLNDSTHSSPNEKDMSHSSSPSISESLERSGKKEFGKNNRKCNKDIVIPGNHNAKHFERSGKKKFGKNDNKKYNKDMELPGSSNEKHLERSGKKCRHDVESGDIVNSSLSEYEELLDENPNNYGRSILSLSENLERSRNIKSGRKKKNSRSWLSREHSNRSLDPDGSGSINENTKLEIPDYPYFASKRKRGKAEKIAIDSNIFTDAFDSESLTISQCSPDKNTSANSGSSYTSEANVSKRSRKRLSFLNKMGIQMAEGTSDDNLTQKRGQQFSKGSNSSKSDSVEIQDLKSSPALQKKKRKTLQPISSNTFDDVLNSDSILDNHSSHSAYNEQLVASGGNSFLRENGAEERDSNNFLPVEDDVLCQFECETSGKKVLRSGKKINSFSRNSMCSNISLELNVKQNSSILGRSRGSFKEASVNISKFMEALDSDSKSGKASDKITSKMYAVEDELSIKIDTGEKSNGTIKSLSLDEVSSFEIDGIDASSKNPLHKRQQRKKLAPSQGSVHLDLALYSEEKSEGDESKLLLKECEGKLGGRKFIHSSSSNVQNDGLSASFRKYEDCRRPGTACETGVLQDSKGESNSECQSVASDIFGEMQASPIITRKGGKKSNLSISSSEFAMALRSDTKSDTGVHLVGKCGKNAASSKEGPVGESIVLEKETSLECTRKDESLSFDEVEVASLNIDKVNLIVTHRKKRGNRTNIPIHEDVYAEAVKYDDKSNNHSFNSLDATVNEDDSKGSEFEQPVKNDKLRINVGKQGELDESQSSNEVSLVSDIGATDKSPVIRRKRKKKNDMNIDLKTFSDVATGHDPENISGDSKYSSDNSAPASSRDKTNVVEVAETEDIKTSVLENKLEKGDLKKKVNEENKSTYEKCQSFRSTLNDDSLAVGENNSINNLSEQVFQRMRRKKVVLPINASVFAGILGSDLESDCSSIACSSEGGPGNEGDKGKTHSESISEDGEAEKNTLPENEKVIEASAINISEGHKNVSEKEAEVGRKIEESLNAKLKVNIVSDLTKIDESQLGGDEVRVEIQSLVCLISNEKEAHLPITTCTPATDLVPESEASFTKIVSEVYLQHGCPPESIPQEDHPPEDILPVSCAPVYISPEDVHPESCTPEDIPPEESPPEDVSLAPCPPEESPLKELVKEGSPPQVSPSEVCHQGDCPPEECSLKDHPHDPPISASKIICVSENDLLCYKEKADDKNKPAHERAEENVLTENQAVSKDSKFDCAPKTALISDRAEERRKKALEDEHLDGKSSDFCSSKSVINIISQSVGEISYDNKEHVALFQRNQRKNALPINSCVFSGALMSDVESEISSVCPTEDVIENKGIKDLNDHRNTSFDGEVEKSKLSDSRALSLCTTISRDEIKGSVQLKGSKKEENVEIMVTDSKFSEIQVTVGSNDILSTEKSSDDITNKPFIRGNYAGKKTALPVNSHVSAGALVSIVDSDNNGVVLSSEVIIDSKVEECRKGAVNIKTVASVDAILQKNGVSDNQASSHSGGTENCAELNEWEIPRVVEKDNGSLLSKTEGTTMVISPNKEVNRNDSPLAGGDDESLRVGEKSSIKTPSVPVFQRNRGKKAPLPINSSVFAGVLGSDLDSDGSSATSISEVNVMDKVEECRKEFSDKRTLMDQNQKGDVTVATNIVSSPISKAVDCGGIQAGKNPGKLVEGNASVYRARETSAVIGSGKISRRVNSTVANVDDESTVVGGKSSIESQHVPVFQRIREKKAPLPINSSVFEGVLGSDMDSDSSCATCASEPIIGDKVEEGKEKLSIRTVVDSVNEEAKRSVAAGSLITCAEVNAVEVPNKVVEEKHVAISKTKGTMVLMTGKKSRKSDAVIAQGDDENVLVAEKISLENPSVPVFQRNKEKKAPLTINSSVFDGALTSYTDSESSSATRSSEVVAASKANGHEQGSSKTNKVTSSSENLSRNGVSESPVTSRGGSSMSCNGEKTSQGATKKENKPNAPIFERNGGRKVPLHINSSVFAGVLGNDLESSTNSNSSGPSDSVLVEKENDSLLPDGELFRANMGGGYFESTRGFIVLDAKSPFSRINKDLGDVSSILTDSSIEKNPAEEVGDAVPSVKGHGSPSSLKASISVADVEIIRHNSNHTASYEMVNPIALSSHHQEIIDIPSHSLSHNSDLKKPVMGLQPPSPDKMILPDVASMGIEVGESLQPLSVTPHVSKAGLSLSKLLSPCPSEKLHAPEQGLPGENLIADMKEPQQASSTVTSEQNNALPSSSKAGLSPPKLSSPSPPAVLHAPEQGLPGENLIADVKEPQQASSTVTSEQNNVIPSPSKAPIKPHDSSQVPVQPPSRRNPRSSVRGISAIPRLIVPLGKIGAVSSGNKTLLESLRPASSMQSKLNRPSSETLPSVDIGSYTSSNSHSSGEKHVPLPAEKNFTPSQTESHSTSLAPKSQLLVVDDIAPNNSTEGQMSERAAINDATFVKETAEISHEGKSINNQTFTITASKLEHAVHLSPSFGNDNLTFIKSSSAFEHVLTPIVDESASAVTCPRSNPVGKAVPAEELEGRTSLNEASSPKPEVIAPFLPTEVEDPQILSENVINVISSIVTSLSPEIVETDPDKLAEGVMEANVIPIASNSVSSEVVPTDLEKPAESIDTNIISEDLNPPSSESEVIHLEKPAEAILGINFASSTCHSVSEEIKLNLPSPSKDINGHHVSTEEVKSSVHSFVKNTTRDKSGNLFTSTKIIEKVGSITSSSEPMSAPNEPRPSNSGKKSFKYSNLTCDSELLMLSPLNLKLLSSDSCGPSTSSSAIYSGQFTESEFSGNALEVPPRSINSTSSRDATPTQNSGLVTSSKHSKKSLNTCKSVTFSMLANEDLHNQSSEPIFRGDKSGEVQRETSSEESMSRQEQLATESTMKEALKETMKRSQFWVISHGEESGPVSVSSNREGSLSYSYQKLLPNNSVSASSTQLSGPILKLGHSNFSQSGENSISSSREGSVSHSGLMAASRRKENLVKSVTSKSSSISSIDAESEQSCSYVSKDESSASTKKDRKRCDDSNSPKPEDDLGRIVDNVLRKLDEACEQHRKQEMEKAQSTVQQFASLLPAQHNLGKKRKLENCARGQPRNSRRKKGPSEQPVPKVNLRRLPAWCSKSIKKVMVEAMESREMSYLDQEEFLFDFADTVKLVMKSKDATEVQDGVLTVQKQLFDLNIVKTLGDFFQFVRNYLPYEFRCRSIPCSGWNDPLYATWVDDSDLKRPLFE